MQMFVLTQPDDWHVHLRDGEKLRSVLPHTAAQFARALVMPNLVTPVTTVALAKAYYHRIIAALPEDSHFMPLMTLYLTDNTSVEEIYQAKQCGFIYAVKWYPAGATTHSAAGVTDIGKLSAVLSALSETGFVLSIHGEVTNPTVDIFDREAIFIKEVLDPLRISYPTLKVVLEHITTREAVHYVQQNDHIAATITPQHLLLNRNALLVGGIQPHHYCLPVLKREKHRQALLAAATSGDSRFFLGTDSAPHAKNAKENTCGCAGVYSAHAAIELYAKAFASVDAFDKLEAFMSFYGADFYGVPRNTSKVLLQQEKWTVPASYPFADQPLIPFYANKELQWKCRALLSLN